MQHLNEDDSNSESAAHARQPVKKNQVIGAFTGKNIEAILRHEKELRKRKSFLHRVVQKIAAFCGSLSFLWLQVVWFSLWIFYNLNFKSFDPYPFPFLMLVVSLEAIFLSVLILISQNLSSLESERRHHLDLQINLLAERETTVILRLLSKMSAKMEVSDEDRGEVLSFSDDTDPASVLQQIIRAERKHHAADG